MKHVKNEPPYKIMTGSEISKSILTISFVVSHILILLLIIQKIFFKYFEANDYLYQDFI